MLGRRHHIFGQFLTLIAGAGRTHTGVHPEDFTEDMMVSLPMDNYEDLKVSSQNTFYESIQTSAVSSTIFGVDAHICQAA